MRKARYWLGWAMVSAAIYMASVTAFGATTQVNPGGNINAAIAAAANGDTVQVNAGTYTQSVNVTRSNVAVVASGKVYVTGLSMVCNDCTLSGFTSLNPTGSAWLAGNRMTFSNNEISGLRLSQWEEDYGHVQGDNNVIRRNFIHGLRIPLDLGAGPDYKHNDVFQFWNNNGEQLHNLLIEENIFTDYVQGVFLANETGDLSSMSNLTIRNNIFWGTDFISDGNLLGNPSHGLFVGKADVTGVSITNNLFRKNANCVSLYAMTSAVVQGNIIANGGTAYAVGDGTQASAFNRGTIGNVLWSNGWNGYPAQGPDKYLDPMLGAALVGASGDPWGLDAGWRPRNTLAAGYGPQMAPTGGVVVAPEPVPAPAPAPTPAPAPATVDVRVRWYKTNGTLGGYAIVQGVKP